MINDVRNIINPITSSIDINHFLEKMIVHNIDIDSYMLNHFLFNNINNTELKETIISSIKNHYIILMRKQRQHFRDRNKKGKLDIDDFNSFFVSINKLMDLIINSMEHIYIIDDNIDIMRTIVRNIIDFIITDMSFKNCITNYLRNIPPNIKKFRELFSYLEGYYSIINIVPRKDNKIAWNNDIKNIIFKNLTKCSDYNQLDIMIVPKSEYEGNILFDIINDFMDSAYINNKYIDINNKYINQIYEFRDMVAYLKKWQSQFQFMISYHSTFHIYREKSYQSFFNKLKDKITGVFTNIIMNGTIEGIKEFFSYYEDEIKYIVANIKDIEMIMMSYIPSDIETSIYYLNRLYNIGKNNYIIQRVIQENVKKIFNTIDKIEYIVNIINNLVIDNNIINNDIDGYYYIISVIDNIDEAMVLLTQKLIERFIYINTSINTSIYIETENYAKMCKVFDNNMKILYRYNVVMNDIKETIKFESTELIVSTPHVWKINYAMGDVENLSNRFYSNIITEASKKYTEKYMNRKLIYYPHMGMIDTTINGANVIMLPFHMFILEHFIMPGVKLTKDDIMNKLKNMNYPDTVKHKIIDSLVIGEVLILSGDYYYAGEKISDVNLIEIFYNINTYELPTMQNMIVADLAHERMDIVKSNINHFVKVKEYNEDDLYKLVSNNITIFKMTKELFIRALTNMEKNEYIKKDGDKVVKIIW
jgi:hypothetical protein